MKAIDIRTSSYFSTGFKFAGMVLLMAGAILLFVNVFIGLAAALFGVVILTTHYGLSIDPVGKTYYDYVWLLGLKTGERGKFDTIQYIYITKSKVSEKMHSRASSATIVYDEYNAYLKLSDKTKIHLGSDEDKAVLVIKTTRIAGELNCDVMEATSSSTPSSLRTTTRH